MNTLTKSSSSLSYLVCPITGLSVSFKDDYASTQLFPKHHPLVIDPDRLYKLVHTKGSSTLPKSYIVAAIFLRLTENNLISEQHEEPKYLRGQLLSQLEQEHRYTLVKLFWAVYNSTAHLKVKPFRISLAGMSTYLTYKPMIALLFAVAGQEFTEQDQEHLRHRTTASWAKSTVCLTSTRVKQDPISARNRVHAQLTKVLRMIEEAEAEQLLEHPGKEVSGIYSTKPAQQRITEQRPFLLMYHNCSIQIRHQLASTLRDTLTLALRYSILDQDEPLAKSFRIVIDLVLSFEADPINLGLDIPIKGKKGATFNEEW